MNKIELTDKQLQLVSQALDLYSRLSIGQLKEILKISTVDKMLLERNKPQKNFEAGDRCWQGEMKEIKNNKVLIKKDAFDENGNKKNKEEWENIEDIELTPDWEKYHQNCEAIENKLNEIKNIIFKKENDIHSFGKGGHMGIFGPQVSDDAKLAAHIHQEIRHYFWKKRDPDKKNNYTVDAYPADIWDIAKNEKLSIQINDDEN